MRVRLASDQDSVIFCRNVVTFAGSPIDVYVTRYDVNMSRRSLQRTKEPRAACAGAAGACTTLSLLDDAALAGEALIHDRESAHAVRVRSVPFGRPPMAYQQVRGGKLTFKGSPASTKAATPYGAARARVLGVPERHSAHAPRGPARTRHTDTGQRRA